MLKSPCQGKTASNGDDSEALSFSEFPVTIFGESHAKTPAPLCRWNLDYWRARLGNGELEVNETHFLQPKKNAQKKNEKGFFGMTIQ